MTEADLNRLDRLRDETIELREQLRRRRNASAISAVPGPHPGAIGGPGDPLGDAAVSAVEVEEQILRNVLEMVELIDTAPKAHVRRVMRRRYIDGWSWGRIAGEMGYTDSAAPYRLLCRARKAVLSKHRDFDNGMTREHGVK